MVKKRAEDSDASVEEQRAESAEIPTDEQRAEADMARSELQLRVLLRDQIQKIRIAEGNRAAAATKLEEEDRAKAHTAYAERLQAIEDEVTEGVVQEMREHPAWPWLKDIHGVGETSAALVVGYIDIERCETVSALWRFAGYGVATTECEACAGTGTFAEGTPGQQSCATCFGRGTIGKRERHVKGEKSHYNARLKTMVWRLIDLQVKHRGPFRKAYDEAKQHYTDARPTWTKGHVEAASRRKAAKLFLSMLHEVWRTATGLPVREPWVIEYGEKGHDKLDPWTYITTMPVKPEKEVVE